MYENVYQEYLDTEVLTADPLKRVQMMYRGALDAIASARVALSGGEIRERSRQITKAVAILNELAVSLDRSQSPELCANLVELYDYMARRLNQSNIAQSEAPLVEVATLLSELLGAWQQIASAGMEAPKVSASAASIAYSSEAYNPYQRLSFAY